MKAMILAAGLGTRLLPYTRYRPKPLFPILNRPLLKLTISRLKKAGAEKIIVNAHHLQNQMLEALQDEMNVILQLEDTILGTGGGLRMALEHFDQTPVLVVNGDIYHSIDYNDVYRCHLQAGADVTLVLHDYPRYNTVRIDADSRITGFAEDNSNSSVQDRILAFTGIHVINPDVLQTIQRDGYSCIIDCYKKFLAQGGSINPYFATDHYWTDMGTPADYLKLHGDLLGGRVPVYEELAAAIEATPFVRAGNVSIGRDVTLLDWACIGENTIIEAGAVLQRSVIWDNVTVRAGSVIKDTIMAA
jgi:mannose-1-phosphate guanylyltransferase